MLGENKSMIVDIEMAGAWQSPGLRLRDDFQIRPGKIRQTSFGCGYTPDAVIVKQDKLLILVIMFKISLSLGH